MLKLIYFSQKTIFHKIKVCFGKYKIANTQYKNNNKHIEPFEVALSIKHCLNAFEKLRDSFKVSLRETIDVGLYVLIKFPIDAVLTIKAVNPADKNAFISAGIPVNQELSIGTYKNSVSLHEIGHVFFTDGEQMIRPTNSLGSLYHWMGLSDYSVSRTYGFSGMRYSPLLARYFRCFINACVDKDGWAYHD